MFQLSGFYYSLLYGVKVGLMVRVFRVQHIMGFEVQGIGVMTQGRFRV